MKRALLEGRCTQCGYRVTLEPGAEFHRAPDGRRCGPVEVHRPDRARDQPYGQAWVAT
jgi:predicted RNA-binding Zn-ribbon protein involved in translation (DUF1610 family)